MATELLTPPQPPTASSAEPFEAFFRQHYSRVYGLLFRVTGNAHDAEDLSQELFLQLSRRQPPVWQTPLAASWLWKAASHTALNALRGDRRRTAREERALRQDMPGQALAEQDEDPAGSLLRKERQEAVRRALQQLPPRDELLLLSRHSGLSYAEVAAALDLNPGSVGTLLARAEERFKRIFNEQENPDGNR